MTIEHGKPFGESLAEVNLSADITDWLGEEARRSYGRLIPSRSSEIYQMVVKERNVLETLPRPLFCNSFPRR